MTTTRLQYLMDRYYQQQATSEEVDELMALLAQHPELPAQLPQLLQQQWEALSMADPQFAAAQGAPLLQHILATRKPTLIHTLARYRWAAAVLVFIGLTGALWFQYQHKNVNAVAQAAIRPGSSKAMLTLADGHTIPLDSNGQQVLRQGGAVINQQGGQLRYDDAGQSTAVTYNTLQTPRGGQFRLVLPDGTQVWLNATSSITYPTAFNSNERQVSVTGEVFFDVAANAGKPFRVKVNETTNIEVLGTQFNVNAYTDEKNIRTTLLQGKVKVAGAILRPGQQASTDAASGQTAFVDNANVEQAVAWKNGLFDFDGKDLPEVLRQLSRWYDVDVIYTGKIPQRRFGGEMQRELQLGQVLKILEKMDVKYKIEGKKLIVEPA